MCNFFTSKKASAEIYMVVLITLVAISITVGLVYFGQRTTQTFEETAEEKTESELISFDASFYIYNIYREDNKIEIKNNGKVGLPVDSLNVYINGTDVSKTLECSGDLLPGQTCNIIIDPPYDLSLVPASAYTYDITIKGRYNTEDRIILSSYCVIIGNEDLVTPSSCTNNTDDDCDGLIDTDPECCVDSDGYDHTNLGTCQDQWGCLGGCDDKCILGTSDCGLDEYYCERGRCEKDERICPTGSYCSGGACVSGGSGRCAANCSGTDISTCNFCDIDTMNITLIDPVNNVAYGPFEMTFLSETGNCIGAPGTTEIWDWIPTGIPCGTYDVYVEANASGEGYTGTGTEEWVREGSEDETITIPCY
jgi:archaellum component FlaF (FlaF/FlaG flagellin family)